MQRTAAIRFKSWASIAVAVMGLSACAENGPHVERHMIVDGLDATMINTVLIKGFGDTQDRAYQTPDIDTLFTAALRNLKAIDPAIRTSRANGQISIDYNEQHIGDLRAPTDSIEAWSLLAIKAIVIARKTSPLLRKADEELLYKAIFDGALGTLDGFSRYASFQEASRNRLLRDGVIGLGVRVETHPEGVQIQSIVVNGPAESAGLKINDIITHANGELLVYKPLSEVRRILDGSAGDITLTVQRPETSELLTITATRDLVTPDTVTSSVNGGVLEIGVRSFNQRTAAGVEKAVNAARREHDSKIKGIVLDLRGDPGGLLDQAIDIADLFINDGTIATLEGRHSGAHQYYAARRGDIAAGIPMAVIIDGKSASAAEVVAAALQDNRRAVVVGTSSWGKGSVQTLLRLPNGGEIALTWAHVATPRGAALHGLGLLPDVCLSGTPVSVGDVVGQVYASPSLSKDNRRLWRTPADNPATHEALRALCPAEPHPDRAVDLEVARRIVSDPVLRAMALREDSPQLDTTP